MASLPGALVVRRLRNSCARHMTRARDPIAWWSQVLWYVRQYRRALRQGSYRVYLFSEAGDSVGYGALQLKNGQLLVTECVAAKHRGRGIGTLILDELISIARHEQRDLVAEIWTSNRPSIRLHEKAGFALANTLTHDGSDLSVYHLSAS